MRRYFFEGGIVIPCLWNAVDLFHQCEWGGNATKHAIASSGLMLSGQTLAQAERAPVTTTSGYLYSGETFAPTGLRLKGEQVILQKPGCRPQFHVCQKLWSQAATSNESLTCYINRFSDGAVWISSTANSRSGTQISWPTNGTILPRGIRYVNVMLVGGGGGGGSAGGSLQNSAAGGGGSATTACCIRLPENGYATITIGGGGTGGTARSNGSTGGDSIIRCGTFWCIAGGGAGGSGDVNSGNGNAAGGIESSSGNNVDGFVFASANGSAGAAKRSPANDASMTINDYSPDGTGLAYSSPGGSGQDRAGNGGGGGASAYYGNGGNGGYQARGADGGGYGGGGGGGGNYVLQQYGGGNGAAGYCEVRY